MKVKVLLATYNGVNWINEQLTSILEQSDVNVSIYISDDYSDDGTEVNLEVFSRKEPRIHILPKNRKFGSAGKNFYRLIEDVDSDDCDYLAFADQDDIWEHNKLIRHIKLAQQNGADGVSSSVVAFWADGNTKLLVKSQPQRKFDYIFESAGPGCTFLMTPWLVNKVREQLNNENSAARKVALHDWLTYAVCRAHGRKWIIDSTPSVQYRQHHSNLIGANVGLKAKWFRLLKLGQGWYREEVSKVSQVCAAISGDIEIKKISSLLSRRHILIQIKLLFYASQARRGFLDRLSLGLLVLFFLF